MAALARLSQAAGLRQWNAQAFGEQLDLDIAHVWIRGDSANVAAGMVFWHVADAIELQLLCVDGTQRRAGHGHSMLQALLAFGQAHKVDCVHLEVRASNDAAVRLYHHCGFLQVGVRSKYYADNQEDARIMLWRSPLYTRK